MSWVEKIQKTLSITTGDGKVYRPLYKDFLIKEIPYNIAEFEFPNVAGTKVYRGTPKGTRHDIEIFFQGEDNIDQAKDFETSCIDSRVWKIDHPIHGLLVVHPISLKFDFTGLNVCRITGTVVETIEDDYPKITQSVPAAIGEKTSLALQSGTASFQSVQLESSDLVLLRSNNDKIYNRVSSKIKEGLNAYRNAFSSANASISTGLSSATTAIAGANSFLTYPFLFVDSVKNKMSMLTNQLGVLNSTVSNVTSVNEKKIYENSASATVISMINTVANPSLATDYATSNDVFFVLDNLTNAYNSFVENINSLQSETGGELNSFLPNSEVLINLTSAFNLVSSQLFNIAVNSKQQRSFILNYDTNLILLTHRLYGLVPDDSTIVQLMNDNNLSMDELLQIPANKIIYYYV